MTLEEFKRKIRTCWSKDTAYRGIWSKDNPARNQCAVTALLVQDEFGGVVYKCKYTNGDSHYWNVLSDGTTVLDLTGEQYAEGTITRVDNSESLADRAKMLAGEDTESRYMILKERLSR